MDDWKAYVTGLCSGDAEACQRFWGEYGDALVRVAGRNINAAMQRRVDSEDVVQSVCRTFFRRANEGQFSLEDSDGLWRLLCAITVAKTRMHARFHLRQRRSLADEKHFDSVQADGTPVVGEAAGGEQLPDDQVAFIDQFQHLLEGLHEKERTVLDMRLQQLSNAEIAEKLNCSERTVRRQVEHLQTTLSRVLLDCWQEA